MGDAAVVSEYTVTGMVCQHCVSAVTQELGALQGVTDVQVELATGQVTVTSDGPLDRDAVRAAVDEAGYEISG
jgi:copper chaperone